MPDGYLISVGVKADFSELKQESAQGAEAIEEMASEIASALSDASDAADSSGASFTAMAEAYAEVEAQGLQTVEVMNALAAAAAEQATAAAEADAASIAAASDTTESMSAAALASGRLSAAYEAMAGATLIAANSQNRVSDVLRQYRAGALAAGVATSLLSAELRENAAATAQLAASKSEAIAAQTALSEAEERAAAATSENTAATTESAGADAEEAAAAAEDATAVEALGAAHGASVSQVQAASGAIREFEGALPIRAVERFSVTTLGLGPILQAAFPVIGAIAFGEVILQTTSKLAGLYTELLGIKTLREDIEKGNAQDAQRGGQAQSQAIQTQHEVSMKSNPIGTLAVDIDQQAWVVQALEARIAAAQKDAEALRQAATTANPVFGQSAEKDKMEAGGMDSYAAAMGAELAQQQAILARMQQQFQEEKDKEAKAAETAEERKQRAAEATERKQEEDAKKYQESQERLRKGEAEADNGMDKVGQGLQKETDKSNDEMFLEYQKELQAELKKSNAELDEQAKKTREAMEQQLALNQNQQSSVKAAAQDKQISPSEEAAQLQALEAQKIGIENAYYEALEALYGSDSVEWQKMEDERLSSLQKGSSEQLRIQQTLAKQLDQPFLKAFDEIGKQWMSVQDRILKGQISIGRGMQQLASTMLLDMIHGYEQMLMQTIRFNLAKAASNTVTNTQMVANNASSAAASQAVTSSNALKEVFIHAKVAAAKAFDWASAWGGPIAGAIAGAAAFTGVMALAAFEQGGIVGGSIGSAVPIVAHAGERVLTTSQTATFERMVNGGGKSSGTTIHNGGNTFNGVADKKTFAKMLGQHERTIAKTTKKAIRNGRI